MSAAAWAQRALAEATWVTDAPVRVRMGLHTGIGTLGGDDYVSVDVNRAARIAQLAHGGQVLLSDASRALVEGALPADASLKPLGEFQPQGPGPARAPPPARHRWRARPSSRRCARSIDPSATSRTTSRASSGACRSWSSLPRSCREAAGHADRPRRHGQDAAGDRARARAWPASSRTGRGSSPLDAVRDPELVMAAIASSFSLVESPGTHAARPPRRATWPTARRCSCSTTSSRSSTPRRGSASCSRRRPRLHVLVTSRAPLRLSVEQEYPVAPLGVPDLSDRTDDALESESVRLFVERAGRVKPGFSLSVEDTPAVAEICQRLDGLPLGIELAASRVGMFPPRALAERLRKQLDVPGRQVPRPAGATADARAGDRVELRPARCAVAAAARPPLGLRRRVPAGGGRGGRRVGRRASASTSSKD